MSTDLDKPFTAAEFLTERRDFLRVRVVPGEAGGWDVVVRFDGTYSDKQMAENAAKGIKEWFESLADIPKDRWHMWRGPRHE